MEGWESSGKLIVSENRLDLVDPGISGVTKGDINNDGAIDAFDMILEKQVVITNVQGNWNYDPAADVDNDGIIGVNDLVLLTKFLLGEIKNFPDK